MVNLSEKAIRRFLTGIAKDLNDEVLCETFGASCLDDIVFEVHQHKKSDEIIKKACAYLPNGNRFKKRILAYTGETRKALMKFACSIIFHHNDTDLALESLNLPKYYNKNAFESIADFLNGLDEDFIGDLVPALCKKPVREMINDKNNDYSMRNTIINVVYQCVYEVDINIATKIAKLHKAYKRKAFENIMNHLNDTSIDFKNSDKIVGMLNKKIVSENINKCIGEKRENLVSTIVLLTNDYPNDDYYGLIKKVIKINNKLKGSLLNSAMIDIRGTSCRISPINCVDSLIDRWLPAKPY